MKYNTAYLLLVISLLLGCGLKKNQHLKMPLDPKKVSGNPVFEGWYADPEGAIFNNQYWIFPTFSANYDAQVFIDAFSSKDLVSWQKHPRVLDTSIVKWAHRALWAPSVIEKENKYYLFFSANDIQQPGGPYWDEHNPNNHSGGIGIAISDTPSGPYRDYLGEPLISEFFHGAQPIDQFVFKDDDNRYYIIYGGWKHCNIGILNDTFTGFVPLENNQNFREITPKDYVEGPVMFKRNGIYYFMWSEGSWGDDTYRVSYGISKDIWGPYEKIGTILKSDPSIATGAGHNSILHIPNSDDWFVVYHRRPIPNGGRDHRVTCIDKLMFNEDGTIQEVIMTFTGVEPHPLNSKINNGK